MPDWANLDSALLAAAVAAIVALIGHLFNRQSRRDEVNATQNDSLLQSQGDQISRLTNEQKWMRQRLDWLEDEIWTERAHAHRLHRGLSESADWGPRMERWAQGDQRRPYPSPPDWEALRNLLDTPRPRRPPPIPDST